MDFNLAQTFYVDANKVNNSSFVYLTSISLFFKAKPNPTKTLTGTQYPGVSLYIAQTSTGTPDVTNIYRNSLVRVEYPSINSSGSPEMPTVFTFPTPIPVSTGTSYALILKFDDPNFLLWEASVGDRIFGTNNPFQGVTNFQGNLFQYSNNGNWLPLSSTDLKMIVNVAQFTSNTVTIKLTDDAYEFFTVSNQASAFVGGEKVFVNTAQLTGNLSITALSTKLVGNGTSNLLTTFVVGDSVVVNSGNTNIVRVVSAVNSSVITAATPVQFTNANCKFFKSVVGTVMYSDPVSNTLYLASSSANGSLYFSTNTLIVGEVSGATANIFSINDISVHQFLPEFLTYIPPNGYANLSYNFAYANSGPGYAYNNTNSTGFINNTLETISAYNALLLSRSHEVLNANSLFSSGKSAQITANIGMNLSTTNLYQSPLLYSEKLDLFVSNNQINNDLTNENTTYGNAHSKHITTRVTFAQGYSAEDVFIYLNAYQPATTNLAVYAKVKAPQDSDVFNLKDWTLLASNASTNSTFSQSATDSNLVALNFNLPSAPPSKYTANGTVNVVASNAVIVGVGTNFGTEILVGDLVKIYSQITPQNYFVAAVLGVTNTTYMTTDFMTTNNSVLGTSFAIDKIATPHTAFTNPQNNNISRYYDTKMAAQDTFNTMQIKIDLLSANPQVVPRIESIRAIATST